MDIHGMELVRGELTTARAERAEALRRATHLRSIGAALAAVKAAMAEADQWQSEVNRLLRSLREVQSR